MRAQEFTFAEVVLCLIGHRSDTWSVSTKQKEKQTQAGNHWLLMFGGMENALLCSSYFSVGRDSGNRNSGKKGKESQPSK